MRTIELTVIFFLFITQCIAQTNTRRYVTIDVTITKEKKPTKVFTKVEIVSQHMPEDSSLVKSLEKNLNQSIQISKKSKAGNYLVSVKFLIERDGSFADVQCFKDPGFELCKQVTAVIKKKSHWGSAL